MEDWQPIATAPQFSDDDFDPFGPDLLLSNGQQVVRGFWSQYFTFDDHDGGEDTHPEGWFASPFRPLSFTPTLWSPARPVDPD